MSMNRVQFQRGLSMSVFNQILWDFIKRQKIIHINILYSV